MNPMLIEPNLYSNINYTMIENIIYRLNITESIVNATLLLSPLDNDSELIKT